MTPLAAAPVACLRLDYETDEQTAHLDDRAPLPGGQRWTVSGSGGGADAAAAGGASGAATNDSDAGAGAGGVGGFDLDAGNQGGTSGGAFGGPDAATAGTGGAGGSSGAGGTGGGSGSGGGSGGSSGGAGGSGPAPSQPCVLLGTEVLVSQFDTGPGASVQATGAGNPSVVWTSQVGHPAPGALDFRNPLGGDAELSSSSPSGDFSGRTLLVNVFVESGPSVSVTPYADSAPPSSRARGVSISPAPGAWACASLDFSDPDSETGGFNPALVQTLGLEISGASNVRVYVDQVAY